ncbi:MAG: tripartite tricarboxylate transporter TctB [Rhizobiales bacterium 62-17]|mgnify:CR=1 FL=1|nr:tripartite tricarboxylate transporter TctB family protein [Hyphomicrobiales bacterium]OJY00700.1 MAG: tripartite tricarboxylate transporter TctB [Rhizobiales bacterium 62-17]
MNSRLNSETIAGLLFVLIGAAFLIGSYGLSFGTWRKIGPGGFPAMVSVALIGMGLFVAIKSLRTNGGEPLSFQFGNIAVIVASIVVFGLTVRGAGLLPAVLACSLVSALASKPFRPLIMIAYGLFMGAACSLVFVKGLGMPVAIIGPWFGV